MTCPTGKAVHITYEHAAASSKRTRHRTEKPLSPYHCTVCNAWHVGQGSGKEKRPLKTINQHHEARRL